MEMHYGSQLSAQTFLDPAYFQSVPKAELNEYLNATIVPSSETLKVPGNFTKNSRFRFSSFGSLVSLSNSSNLTAEEYSTWYLETPFNVVPIKVVLVPIYELIFKEAGLSLETWVLALDTYTFEYELRSIEEVLTALKGDPRSDLCAAVDLHLRGFENLRFTRQYLAMEPFPARSAPLYGKVPGGYRDRIAWHLGQCIPNNRDMYYQKGDPIPE